MSPTRLGRHILRLLKVMLECCITENGFLFLYGGHISLLRAAGEDRKSNTRPAQRILSLQNKRPSEETLERFKDEDEEKSTTRQSLGVFQVVSGRSTTLTSRTQSGVELGPNVLEMHNKVLMSFSCKQELKSLYFSRSEEVTNAKIKVKSSLRES